LSSNQNIKVKWTVIAIAAVVILLGSKCLYHLFELRLKIRRLEGVMLNTPLRQFPYEILTWQGADVPISETVLKVAANDDYLSRLYVDQSRQLDAMMYIAYTTEPKLMLGHRPRRCYVNSGWGHEWTRDEMLELEDGTAIPCLIHKFQRTGLQFQTVFVLNYYVINGVVSSDHNDFDRLEFRHPRGMSRHVNYVAQIQISSSSELAIRTAARECSHIILRYFPEDVSVADNGKT
jgi:hypothetical protein